LTGVPTAPTAAANTNSTQLATTEFVASGLALKAPLVSPAFTGQPTGVFGYSPAKNVLALGSANDVPGTMIYDEDGDVFYFCVKRAGGKGVWKKLVPLAV